MGLSTEFVALLQPFRAVFTAPSFANWLVLLAGWVLSPRRRFVTELIQSAGAARRCHWSVFHRFFSQAAWGLDALGGVLLRELVRRFVPDGVVEFAIDDTLCRKHGMKLFGVGMHHDPLISSKAKPLTSWGHSWVVLCLVVHGLPWAPGKAWSLPVAFRLYRNRQGITKGKGKAAEGKAAEGKPAKGKAAKGKAAKGKAAAALPHRTRPELAVELLALAAAWLPDRQLIVSGDSAYGGRSVLSKLPGNVDLISHVHPKGRLYAPAPAREPGTKGRPRRRGEPLPSLAAWAADESQPWRRLEFRQFGLRTTLLAKVRQGLYYKAGKDRLLTLVLTRDAEGKRPDHIFYCTRLDWTERQVLDAYSRRWSIEVTFGNAKQFLGLEDPANRTRKAVERTAPMALVAYSLVVLWFDAAGHREVAFPDRPWYRRKREPSFADMLATLRQASWREAFGAGGRPPHETKRLPRLLADFLSRAG